MTTHAAEYAPSRSARLGALVRSELAPFPGRMDTVWRYMLVSALVIVISLTLQIPVLGLSLVIVFFTAQDNATLTLMTCVSGVIGATIAVGIALLLVTFTMGYPLLRLFGAGMILFCAIYFMRISKYGQAGWLTAIAVCYSMTLLDVVNDPERMTRFILWVWVAAVYPAMVTGLVNYLLLPAHPEQLLKEEALRQLEDVDQQLEARRMQTALLPLNLDVIERGVLALHRRLSSVTLASPRYRHDRGYHLMRIHTIDRLRTAAAHLSRLPATGLSPAQQEWISQLQASCRGLQQAIANSQPFALDPALVRDHPAQGPIDAILQEMGHALNTWAEIQTMPPLVDAEVKGPLVAKDWLSNPVYGQFALKTTLAGFVCYVFQSATQWPGIHTAPLTCFIMALPSLGASSRKGLLRVIGCASGSLVTLFVTVFVIPHLVSIPGLLLLTLPIIAAGAWVAAGSDRSNYIGLQFVFAFSLALFGQFGPDTNIPEIRDRMVGIMVGVTVSMVVYTLLWPEREGSELWSMLARLVRSIAGLARVGCGHENETKKQKEIDKARQQGWSMLAANREIESRVALEPGWQYAPGAVTVDLQTWFAQAQETLFSVNWLQTLLRHVGPELPDSVLRSCERFSEDSAKRLDQLAKHLDPLSPNPESISLSASLASFDQICAQMRDGVPASKGIDEIVLAVHAIDERITQLGNHFSQAAQPITG